MDQMLYLGLCVLTAGAEPCSIEHDSMQAKNAHVRNIQDAQSSSNSQAQQESSVKQDTK